MISHDCSKLVSRVSAPDDPNKASITKRIIISICVILLLTLIRGPFLNDLLCGEEGEFAFLVASPIPTAELSKTGLPKGLMGNIGGQLYLGSFSRTIMPYWILENIVGGVTRPLQIIEISNPESRAILIHLIFLSLFLIGALGAIWRLSVSSFPAILSVLWALSTPIAVGASIQPQLDGTIGVMLLGLVAWILSSSCNVFFLILAGFISGLGKHEWALAFLTAALLTLLFQKLFINTFNKSIVWFLLGLFLGVGVSVQMSYSEYSAGFDVMRNFFGEESPLYLARKNFRYLAPTVLAMIICGLIILINFKKILEVNSLVMLLYLTGSAILCGFALSGHNPDLPRYFAPALVIFVYVFLALQPYFANFEFNQNIIYAVIILGFVFNIQYLVYSFSKNYSVTTCATTMPDLILQKKSYDDAVSQNKTNRIPVVSSGIWLYNPNAYFVEESVTKTGGLRILKDFNRENDFEIIGP